MMSMLESLLQSYAAHSEKPSRWRPVHWWMGKRPVAEDDKQTAYAIAQYADLPSTEIYPFTESTLNSVSRAEAAHVLALAGSASLAYGARYLSDEAIETAEKALADLAEDAVFFSNGNWWQSDSCSWTPLTDSTLDAGVIGFDDQNAFVFWVEDED